VSGAAALRDRVAGAPISWGVCEVPDWGWQASPRSVLEEMQELGLRATELGPPGFLPSETRALRALLSRHGLRLVAGFLAVELHTPAVEEQALASLAATADLLAGGGARVLVLAAAGGEAGYERREALDAAAWRRLAETLGAARELVEKRGLALAVHPHAGTLIEGPEEVSNLLQLTDAELCLDSGHLALAGVDPLEVARAAGDRVRLVHLKDVDADVAAQVRTGRLTFAAAVARGLFRPLGEGAVDLAGLVRRLEAGGYRGWYVLEQDVMLPAEPEPGSGPATAVASSLGWFSRLADRITTPDRKERRDGPYPT
jgi:inosose dehydratase